MNDSEGHDKGNLGGNSTGRDTNQTQTTQSHSFIQNGLEHFELNPKKAISWGVLVALVSGVFGIISYTVSGLKMGVSEIDRRIGENPELNRKLTIYEIKLEELDRKAGDHENRIRDLEYLKNAGRKR